jgi:capsular exopolysaccharide synthesis family protein
MLERQVTSSRDLYDDLMKKLQEAGITSGLSADSIAVIDRALPPYVPSFPLRSANLEIGFLIGLILGTALAVLFEIINSSIRTIEDIRLYSGLPSLGLIPHAELLRSAEASDSVESYGRSRRRITDEPRSHFAEAYRNLRSSLLLSSAGEPPQVIVVSSAWPKEGKSTTAINLATVLAQSGKHVLLIDADLKRPSLQRSFENGGLPSSGLSEMLSGSEENAHSIHTDTEIPSLDILFSGRVPPSSSELLMSAQMGKLLDKWRIGYDFIVFDTAPLLAVSDAYYLVSTADAVVLVVRAGSTRRKALRALRDAVLGVRGKIAGVLLNDVKSSSDAYYDYYGGRKENYDIYYSSEK